MFSTSWSDSRLYDEKLSRVNDEIEVSVSEDDTILQIFIIITPYFNLLLFLQEDMSQNGTNFNETLMQRMMSPNKIGETFQSFHVDSPASQMTPLYEPSEVEKLVRAGKLSRFLFQHLVSFKSKITAFSEIVLRNYKIFALQKTINSK